MAEMSMFVSFVAVGNPVSHNVWISVDVKAGFSTVLAGVQVIEKTLIPPLPLYIACLLWLLCLAASLFLGAFFAYCCVFAAIAFEFVMAFYYTVKLK